jgi:peptide chain release factor subunit 3
MSRLNVNAFEFVPGRGFGNFKPPGQPASAPPPPPPAEPIEREEQEEAPRPPPTISLNIGGAPRPPPAQAPAPAPTISLNIGGSKPPAPAVAAAPTPAPAPAKSQPVAKEPALATVQEKAGLSTPSGPASSSASPAPPSNKTFTTERAKTDTNAIANEVMSAADKATLDELYGNGTASSLPPYMIGLHSCDRDSERTSEYRLHRARRCRQVYIRRKSALHLRHGR